MIKQYYGYTDRKKTVIEQKYEKGWDLYEVIKVIKRSRNMR